MQAGALMSVQHTLKSKYMHIVLTLIQVLTIKEAHAFGIVDILHNRFLAENSVAVAL